MAKQEDFRKEEFVTAGLLVRRYELEWEWERRYGASAAVALSAPPVPQVGETARLMTRSEVAKELHLSKSQVDRLRRAGDLRPVQRFLPGKVLFRSEDVQRLKSQRSR